MIQTTGTATGRGAASGRTKVAQLVSEVADLSEDNKDDL